MVTNLLDKTELSKKILYFCRIKRFDSEKAWTNFTILQILFLFSLCRKSLPIRSIIPRIPFVWRQRARSGAICRQRENGRENCGKGRCLAFWLSVQERGKSAIWQPSLASWQGRIDTLISCLRFMTCKSQMAFSESKKNRYRESTGGSRSCRQMCDIKIASNGWLTRRSLPDRFWMIYGDGWKRLRLNVTGCVRPSHG